MQFSFSLKYGRNQPRTSQFSIGIDFLGPDPISNKNKAEKNSEVACFANFPEDPCCCSVITEFAYAFSCAYIELRMHLGSLESTQKAIDIFRHFSCSPNFPRVSITRYTHAKHKQILNSTILKPSSWKCYKTIGSYVSCAFIEIWSKQEVWRPRTMRKSCSKLRLEQLLLLECSVVARFANLSKDPCYRSVIKKFAHAFSCAYIGFWMHLGSLETLTHLLCSPNFPRASNLDERTLT